MYLAELEVDELRCLQRAELAFDPGVNLIIGANGSGKTSILEAIFLLARGRSFRTRHTERLIRAGASRLQVLGRLGDAKAGVIGLACTRDDGVEVRLDRRAPRSLAELSEVFPAQIMDPGIHRLVEEGPSHRRKWLDWGVFHVEPGFVELWSDYSKALKQRNAALKAQQDPTPWDPTLARLGELLSLARLRAVESLLPYWAETTASLLDLNVKLTYYRGWAQERTLAESLAKHLDSDRERQTTGLGAHRFDIVLTCDHKAARDVLSRGQQKLLGSAMTLAMAKLVWAENRQPTVLLLDDPAAELDRTHTQELVREIRTLKGQMVITALDAASSLLMGPGRVFHVEQGRVTTG